MFLWDSKINYCRKVFFSKIKMLFCNMCYCYDITKCKAVPIFMDFCQAQSVQSSVWIKGSFINYVDTWQSVANRVGSTVFIQGGWNYQIFKRLPTLPLLLLLFQKFAPPKPVHVVYEWSLFWVYSFLRNNVSFIRYLLMR